LHVEKTNVIGLGEMRKALKHNLFQIQTYEENKTGASQLSKNPKLHADGANLESQLRKMQEHVGQQHLSSLDSNRPSSTLAQQVRPSIDIKRSPRGARPSTTMK